MKEIKEVVELKTLKENYDLAQSQYSSIFRKLRILDAVDKSKLWQVIGAKFPDYQILPDSNWVSYVKNNIIASIYTVGMSASMQPTSDEDVDAIENLNVALEYIWDFSDVAYYQMLAGANAALYNVGYTYIGWDPDKSEETAAGYYKGNVVLSNISPTKFMRDPFAKDLESSAYCMMWEDLHKNTIMADTRYAAAFKKFLDSKKSVTMESDPMDRIEDRAKAQIATDYYKVITHFVKYIDKDNTVKIAEIHTLNNEVVLFQNEDVLPRRFPIVELYCNLPNDDIIGVSECAKVLPNNIAYNLMNSIALTAEYKNQRPPRFISSGSGLNINTFTKYGSEADHTFIVNGDASQAVHYHQFPQMSNMAQITQASLLADMQTTTGIDGRYTGRDTGSVLTTGGVEDMLNRVTLIDTPKIANYEKYTKELTKIIIANFVEYSMTRTYYKRDPMTNKFTAVDVDYDAISNKAAHHYALNISPELPKNKQRIAAMANVLMEKQMQYGAGKDGAPDLITAEEWLRLQDLPFKEAMMKRMNIQRMSDMTADVADTLYSYAGLVKDGVDPDDAINFVAQNKMAQQRGEAPPIDVPPMADEAYDIPEEQTVDEYQPDVGAPDFDPSLLSADMGLEDPSELPQM